MGFFKFILNLFLLFLILFFLNFARVSVEAQFLGYKFGLKGSTYTRENTVSTGPSSDLELASV